MAGHSKMATDKNEDILLIFTPFSTMVLLSVNFWRLPRSKMETRSDSNQLHGLTMKDQNRGANRNLGIHNNIYKKGSLFSICFQFFKYTG